MEKFKGDLKKRLVFIILVDALAIFLIVVAGIYFNNISIAQGEKVVTDMIRGFQIGIFMGAQVIVLVYIKKYIKALKDREKLRQLYIKENDEREKLIVSKFGSIGFNFCLVVIAIATIITGYFNQVVFVTLLIVALFMSFVKGSLLIYYSHKY
ncbi:hypothetical protein [Clostridium folliculivorans]|uniref:Uncharacterized protein n=1 Tax=Clostridium folliculivorans TaxID=2886038 RepID=A0A9W5Y0B4_9CLOT|nr:hypothetical protein [Clostridium folliculivorans]GKU24221.1 hypothetical protein CFOLD11_10470 [Clostridium folliculivorans]GKU30326.1 hypothetical protein CFB3_24330 [Clostridium folliculivorans]